jgi:hypothetical protein
MKTIRARWKNGVFVPLETVDLPNGTPVLLRNIRIVPPGEQPVSGKDRGGPPSSAGDLRPAPHAKERSS